MFHNIFKAAYFQFFSFLDSLHFIENVIRLVLFKEQPTKINLPVRVCKNTAFYFHSASVKVSLIFTQSVLARVWADFKLQYQKRRFCYCYLSFWRAAKRLVNTIRFGLMLSNTLAHFYASVVVYFRKSKIYARNSSDRKPASRAQAQKIIKVFFHYNYRYRFFHF